ncbi:hypothetical protein CEP54_001426 [Fusarium duplospermum]|uniref:Uncharacterized protein n=1 Tax=Fusarium duplospermum TaxID=1325734 RepID=A0A428R0N3_9HYPO|nr:hypothetical protein CEP54_001426 [Fusarium duplospermum]
MSGTFFERFQNSFWETLQSSAKSVQLRELGLQEGFGQAILGTVNNRDIRAAILSGLLLTFRHILDKGPNWNANDLMGLRPLSSTWPSQGCVGVYPRLYTHQDTDHQNLHDFAIYIGHARKFQKHNQSYLVAVRNGTESHYQVARKSLEEYRYVFPSSKFLLEVTNGVKYNINFPSYDFRGCNVTSPLFEQQRDHVALKTNIVPFKGRTKNVYRIAIRFHLSDARDDGRRMQARLYYNNRNGTQIFWPVISH